MSLIKLKNVSKFYHNKNTVSSGFNKINLELDVGEFVVITGESGSGKTTLLNVISGLDSYEEGEMYIRGEETSHYTEVDYELYRRKYIGNIFQNFNLVNSYTVYQNVELALLFNGYTKKEVKHKVLDIINTVGLTKYKNTKASKLSGGQKQRVAIARALAKDTPIIVADEPTGNLDVKSAKSIMKLLHDISKYKLVVIVTHNYDQVEKYATRKITMHDGKIIEDKHLVETEKVEVSEYPFKNITALNKIGLSFRNAFNIKTKFLLLLLVYFFLTTIVFIVYTSLQKVVYDENNRGENYYFQDTSASRVILNKKDKTSFTTEELNNLKKLDNIQTVIEDDIFLDMYIDLYNNSSDIYMSGLMKDISMIDSVDVGRLPENDNEVIVQGPEWDYYFNQKDLLNSTYTLASSSGEYDKDVTICGIKYIEDENMYNYGYYTMYVSQKVQTEMSKGVNIDYSSIEITINDHIFKRGESELLYYNIKPSNKLNSGEAYVLQELNMYCPYDNCNNRVMNIKVKNLYYEEKIDVKVKRYLTKNNFTYLTGLKNYDIHASDIYISTEDFNKLFIKDTYQVGVFLEDTKKSDITLEELTNLGYNTIYMRDILYQEGGNILGFIKIVRNVLYFIAVIVLFFISYFVIKIILKSRNVYFSTIRILGATKRHARTLLNLELLIDINIAYLLFLGLVFLGKQEIVNIDYIKDIITYIHLIDYILIYCTLIIMSLLISNRYASKLFKNSAMSTIREEA